MSMSVAVRTAFRKYATFSGRARRSEFWWFLLAQTLVVVAMYAVGIVALVLGSDPETGDPSGPVGIGGLLVVLLLFLVLLATIVPYLAVGVRRLHDTGLSGALILVSFIPFGGLVLLFLWARPSQPHPNAYGPDPRLPVGVLDPQAAPQG